MKLSLRLLIWALGIALGALVSQKALAYPGNATFSPAPDGPSPGYITSALWAAADPTPAQTFNGCVSCHGQNGTAPSTFRLNGQNLDLTPNFSVVAGSTTTFTLTWQTAKSTGGFLVMHDDTSANDANGRLQKVPGDPATHQCKGPASGTAPAACNGTFKDNTEVMHEVPRAASGGTITFQFQFVAPAGTCQTYNFGVWINDENGDFTCFNASDYSVLKFFTITTTCASDGLPCTADVCSGGFCAYPPGNSGVVCRPPSGLPCDVAETCNGSSPTCPADGFASGNVCRGSAGPCDVAETCNGASPNCPPNVFSSGNTCRPVAGACDVAEACNGSGPTCPADGFVAGGTSCRGSAGVCDVPESCTGTSASCPANGFQSSSVQCRAPSCNPGPPPVATLPANCTGSSAACPPLQTQTCTPNVCSGNFCSGGCTVDAQCTTGNFCLGGSCLAKRVNGQPCNGNNYCQSNICVDGVCCNAACGGGDPNDCQACNLPTAPGACSPRPAGTQCRASGGVCDAAESCNGSALTCPADAKQPAGTSCRPAAGPCDVAESCNGSSNACPADGFVTAGTQCRAASGVCDAVENCTGSSAACPADGVLPTSALCRAAAGVCDLAENCNGTVKTCPADVFRPATTQCRAPTCAAGTATLAANCPGTSASCPAVQTQACGAYLCGPAACFTTCTVDAFCATGFSCEGTTCQAKKPNGQTCTRDAQCQQGRCVDGYCCDADCTGQCEACDVAGKLGTCSAVTPAPHGSRSPCLTDTSLCAGTCDGIVRTACSYPSAGTVCRAASCRSNSAVLEAFCTGTGACPPEIVQDCGAFMCTGTSCAGDCAVDGDCDPGSFCSGGVCKPKGGVGATCQEGNDCSAGVCVDGYCCDRACTGQCEACDVAGKLGTCSAVTGKPHGTRALCTSDGSPCGGSCDGAATQGCRYPDKTVQCRAPTCTAGVAVLQTFCSGDGFCPAPQQQLCAPNACSGTICGGGCTTDAQCGSGRYCSAGVCVPQLGVGPPCAGDHQCTLGFCVDGFCCASACTGQCEACDVPGFEGFCTTVPSGLPHGGRAACAGAGPCAAGCTGQSTTQCTFPGASTICGRAACSGVAVTSQPVCNGAGSCLPSGSRNCAPYTCDESGCKTSCTTSADCSPGIECINSACGTSVDGGLDGATEPGDAEADAPTAGAAGQAGAGTGGSTSRPDAGVTDAGSGARRAGAAPAEDEGCGCRVVSSRGSERGALLVTLLALLLSRRSRRCLPRVAARS